MKLQKISFLLIALSMLLLVGVPSVQAVTFYQVKVTWYGYDTTYDPYVGDGYHNNGEWHLYAELSCSGNPTVDLGEAADKVHDRTVYWGVDYFPNALGSKIYTMPCSNPKVDFVFGEMDYPNFDSGETTLYDNWSPSYGTWSTNWKYADARNVYPPFDGQQSGYGLFQVRLDHRKVIYL